MLMTAMALTLPTLPFATGLGYQLVRRETFQMEVEAGPGYRHQEPNLDEIR